MLYKLFGGYSEKAKGLAMLDINPNENYRVDRGWSEYSEFLEPKKVFPNGIAEFLKNKGNSSVLELGAGIGKVAEFFKDSFGVERFDNLALTSTKNSFVDKEFIGDIDNFQYSALGEYDLIFSYRGGLYHGHKATDNIVNLTSHLKNGGIFTSDFSGMGNLPMNILASFLKSKGYTVDFNFVDKSLNFIYIKATPESVKYNYSDFVSYYEKVTDKIINDNPGVVVKAKFHNSDNYSNPIGNSELGSYVFNALLTHYYGLEHKQLSGEHINYYAASFDKILLKHFKVQEPSLFNQIVYQIKEKLGLRTPDDYEEFDDLSRLYRYLFDRFIDGQYKTLDDFIDDLKKNFPKREIHS